MLNQSTAPSGAVLLFARTTMKIIALGEKGLQIQQDKANEAQGQKQAWEGELVRASNTFIVVKNPLHSTRAFFVSSYSKRVKISSYISDLVELRIAEINYSFAAKSIIEDEQYGHETLWGSVKCVPPGSILTVSAQCGFLQFDVLEQVEADLHSCTSIFDPMQILRDEIKQRAEIYSSTSICVSFSGGCDSTGLLLAARSIAEHSVSAVTWTYNRGSAHEDLIAASKLASDLGVQHLVLDIDPKHIFEPPAKEELTPNVSTSIAFHHFRKILNSRVLEQYGSGTLMFNGHGGDHIYLDPVPIEVVFDNYRQNGLKSAISTLGSLSFLYGENFIRLLNRKRIQRTNRTARMKFFFNQEALEAFAWTGEERKDGDSKHVHRQLIKQAIYQNSTSALDRRLQLATPFTCPRMIASVWDIPAMAFFDRHSTRIPFRNSMNSFTKSMFSQRSDKGHITGAFQQALKKKQKNIFELIADGKLSSKKIINTKNVLDKISASAQGYGGLDPALLKIICFELMMAAK